MKNPNHMPVHKALRKVYASSLVAPRVDDAGKRRGVPRSVKSLAQGLPRWRSGHLPEDIDPWVWSDQHLGHANIIEYCNRPFRDVAEMDEAFFSAWEAHVGPEDWVVFVGDLAMGRALNEGTFERVHGLPGKRKILVPGNHDVTAKGGVLRVEGFDAIYAMLFAKGEPQLVFTHVPLQEVPEGWVNIHGHTHDRPATDTPHINVSVEQLYFAPVLLSRLRRLARALAAGRYPAGLTTLERLEALEQPDDLS